MIPLVISSGNHDRVMATEVISDAVRSLGIPGTVRQGKGERRGGGGGGEEGEGGWDGEGDYYIPFSTTEAWASHEGLA